MKIIGITGGVGAGKSEVLSFLEEEYGALVIQADRVGHRLMEPGTEVYRAILEKFAYHLIEVHFALRKAGQKPTPQNLPCVL